jgi:addiction module HigA family antidote
MGKNKITPFIAVHPGGILGDELRERKITRKDFAQRIGIQPSHLSELIRGKRNFTPKVSEKIASVLGIPAADWIALQKQYEADRAAVEARKESTGNTYKVNMDTDGYAPDTGAKYHFRLGIYVYEENDKTYAYCPSLDVMATGRDFNGAFMGIYKELGRFLDECVDDDDMIAKLKQRGWTVKHRTIHPPAHTLQERMPQVSRLLKNQMAYSVAYAPVSMSARTRV